MQEQRYVITREGNEFDKRFPKYVLGQRLEKKEYKKVLAEVNKRWQLCTERNQVIERKLESCLYMCVVCMPLVILQHKKMDKNIQLAVEDIREYLKGMNDKNTRDDKGILWHIVDAKTLELIILDTNAKRVEEALIESSVFASSTVRTGVVKGIMAVK